MDQKKTDDDSRASILADLGRILVFRPLTRFEIEAVSDVLDGVGPGDLADAVHSLVAEGFGLDALKPAVSRLINLVSKALGRVAFKPDDPFFESLTLENEAFLRELDALRPLVGKLAAGADRALFDAIGHSIRVLAAIDLHYIKKEHILFPYFESRYPRYRCISLMWSLHDDVRATLEQLASSLGKEAVDEKEIGAALGRLFFDAHALVFREEKVLFPILAELLSLEERKALLLESQALGFCFLSAERVAGLRVDSAASSKPPRETRGPSSSLALDSGSLEPGLVDLILKALPLDLTFVDAEDRVAYFSNGKERVFPRSPAIIGRDVRNCHPAKSVDRVLAIVESFRKGERDLEEFWLETGGRFIRIVYRAIRDSEGRYLGTLEASQDLTEARALEGEKRLAGP